MSDFESRAGHWYQNNVRHGITKDVRRKIVNDTLPIAYLFTRNQLQALRVSDEVYSAPNPRIGDFSEEAHTLLMFSSHYNLVYPYMGDCIDGGIDTLPQSSRYNALFLSTRDGYDGLYRKALRYTFAGEAAIQVKDPEAPIPLDELHAWMIEHSTRSEGFIAGIEDPTKIQDVSGTAVIETDYQLSRFILINRIDDRNSEWISQTSLSLTKRFPKESIKYAVYKLGCGMAVIDQLRQEALNLEIPIPKGFKPTKSIHEEKDLPTIEELWKDSRAVIMASSDPKDELLAGLFLKEYTES